MSTDAARTGTGSRTPIRMTIATLMATMTATLVVASLVHSGVTISAGGLRVHDPFGDAAVPEAVIAAVLGAGTAALLLRAQAAWGIALGSTLVAVAGFLIGVRFTVFGDDPVRGGGVVYQVCGLGLLVITAALLLSPAGRAGGR